MTRLVDHIKRETGVDYPHIMLLRHSNRNVDRLLKLGSTVMEFTSLQPKGTTYDYWVDDKPQIDVVVVIVHDRIHDVYRVLGFQEGTIGSLSSDAHREFDLERGKNLDIPARRFRIEKIPMAIDGSSVMGWENSQRTTVMRLNGKRFMNIKVEIVDDGRLTEEIAEQLEEQGEFDPTGIEDARKRILRAIVLRKGRKKFRESVLSAYERKCAITGCAVEDVLEAAHIYPYKGDDTDHPSNGLLLRADFHTLFDLHLVAIHEDSMKLLISSKLNDPHYMKYHGKKVRIPKVKSRQPSREALKQHRSKSGLG